MEEESIPVFLTGEIVAAMPNPVRHGNCYPMHDDPKKGNIYGGECNRTSCKNMGAVYYNIATHGLYCRTDADGINWQKHKPPLCVDLGKRPSIEEMESLWRDYPF